MTKRYGVYRDGRWRHVSELYEIYRDAALDADEEPIKESDWTQRFLESLNEQEEE